jgi:membrane-associated protease RseP (regulator of RpoE activity)
MDETRYSVMLTISIALISLLGMGSMACGASAGVGIQVVLQDDELTILQVDDSPAEQASLRPGDRIVKINGASTRGVTLFDVVQRLVGPAGEEVTLSILRQAGDVIQRFDVPLTREAIRPRVLPPRMPGEFLSIASTPTRQSHQIEWHGNRIVSRVLPYSDLLTLLIRLPIAHAVATGKGVRVAAIERSRSDGVASAIRQIAPGTVVDSYVLEDHQGSVEQLAAKTRANESSSVECIDLSKSDLPSNR